MRTARIAVLLVAMAAGTSAQAVQPDEVLADTALEERARELSKGLRCLVCRNESIDESDADLARDLRILVRERLVAGDSDAEVIEFVTARYGEFVLLRPNAQGANLILWLAGPAMLLLAAGVAAGYLRSRRAAATADTELSAEETERLKEILRD